MSFEITDTMLAFSEKKNIEPMLVIDIEGTNVLFSTEVIKTRVKIGDPGLEIGGFVIGGLRPIGLEDGVIQKDYMSLEGTTTTIKQAINPDKGISQSISNMTISLIDFNDEVTALITPDETQSPAFDLLGREVRVWLLFKETSWKDDAIIIFRGFISNIKSGAGLVKLNLQGGDLKKKSAVFKKATTELSSSITAGSTSLPVLDTNDFLLPVIGPDLVNDPSLKFFVRIDDEIIRYETTAPSSFGTLTRGALGTTAASHDNEASVDSFYELTGNAVDIALKLMLSGVNGPFIEDIEFTNFNFVTGALSFPDSLFFNGVNAEQEFGVVVGDYATITGSGFGGNNVTLSKVLAVEKIDQGSIVTLDDTLTTELATSAVVAFRSQYDTLGEGFQMSGYEVDIRGHLEVQSFFWSSYALQFYLKDTIQDGKKFIESEIYLHGGGFGVPIESRAGVNVHSPPIPGRILKTIDVDNVKNPDKLILERTFEKNFNNVVAVAYDEDILDDQFNKIKNVVSATSLARIPIGGKLLNIKAKGLKSAFAAVTNIDLATTRRLNKYQFGAETVNSIEVLPKTGFNLSVGDIVLLDMKSLKISDIKNGNRDGQKRLFQIQNKTFDIKSMSIKIDLTDTSFDADQRFGLIGPSSRIKTGIGLDSFIIEETFNSDFGVNEFKKWELLKDAGVLVRSADFTVIGQSKIKSLIGNTVTLETPLAFTPAAGYFMELDEYDNQNDDVKVRYTFMNDAATFADGGAQYQMF